MISSVIVVATAGLVAIAFGVQRHRSFRATMIHVAALTLMGAILMRELSLDQPVPHLGLRLLFLVTQVAVVLLVLSFRKCGGNTRAMWLTGLVALAVGLAQVAMVPYLPTHPDGTIYLAFEVDDSLVGTAYYLLLYVPVIATAAVVAVGCLRAWRLPGQPAVARFSLACVVVGTIIAAIFLCVSILNVLWPRNDGDMRTKDVLLFVGIAVVLTGLALGAAHRVLTACRERINRRIAVDIVQPLWIIVTDLQPGVVLSEHLGKNTSDKIRLARLIIETHDALTLIRGDRDPALAHIHERYPRDPQLSAALILHLAGPGACLRSPRRSTHILNRLLQRKSDLITDSTTDLYDIRTALADRASWHSPALTR